MRTNVLSVLFVTPVLLVSACGGSLSPAANDEMTTDPHEPDQAAGTPRGIRATLHIDSPSCDEATAGFEVSASHTDDSTSVKNVRCHIMFDDGAASDLCLGEHTFASAGAHTFTAEVEDLDTGAITHVEVTRNVAEPLKIDLAVDVPECGLEVSFKATGGHATEVRVSMSPADKVVTPGVFGRTGSFQVLEPGTYTIEVSAEDERPTGPICDREVSRTVTLKACPGSGC
jgi:hypothetical protein